MRPTNLVICVTGILAMSLAAVAEAGSIPSPGCSCLDDSLHCYNMRRDVSGSWGQAGANHTFTMCQDRYGNTSVWEDNWASPGLSQEALASAWVEEDMGCIKLDSLVTSKWVVDMTYAVECPGYAACAGDNMGSECQGSYWLPSGCFCFPWQYFFRSLLDHSFVIECPVQGGGGGGGGSTDPSDYDYGPYFADDWPQWEVDDGASLWRVCIDYCTATSGSAVYSNGEYIGGSVSCIEWQTDCWLEWFYE